MGKLDADLKRMKSDERTKEALKRENENLRVSIVEAKSKIEEFKRALDESEGRLERLKRERGREENVIKGVRHEEQKENLQLEDRLFKLECDLESQLKSKAELLQKLELSEKIIHSYEVDKQNLDSEIRRLENEKLALSDTLLKEERSKSEGKQEFESKDRETYKLRSTIETLISEKKFLLSDKDKFYQEIHSLESKLRLEIETTSTLEKVLITKDRELEKSLEDLRRALRDNAHHEEATKRVQCELQCLQQSQDTGGAANTRLERL
jgi:chromosome segregation ATPase